MTESIVLASEGVPYTSGKTEKVLIPDSLAFNEITLVHNTGTLSGGSSGSYLANTVLEWIKIYANGELIQSIEGDADTDAVPWAVQLLREANKLRNKVADPSEYYRIPLPDAIPPGHKAYVSFKWRAIGDINDGDRTGYDGTLDVAVNTRDLRPGATVRAYRECGKFNFGTDSGVNLTKFFNPTVVGRKCTSILLAIEDNGTASDSAIDKISVKRGTRTLREGSVAVHRLKALERFGITTSTGFVWLPINDYIGAQDLALVARIDSAGTDIDVHWMVTQVA